MKPLHAVMLAVAALCVACGGGSGVAAVAPPPVLPPVTPPVVVEPVMADIRIFMMGNSHTTTHSLPSMLGAMLRAGRPGKTVDVVVAPAWGFLDEHLKNAGTRQLFASRQWNAVVFQAQKYSQSGAFEYSTSEAVEWVRMTRERKMVPVMFPEWPRRDIKETDTIYDIHVGIARQQAACVAPIGQAWDLAALRAPSIGLHSADGNHSAAPGAFLAALMLYATVTGESPLGLPVLTAFDVSDAHQAALRAVADEQAKLLSPRTWCPDDVKL
jgi:hypothetical protein